MSSIEPKPFSPQIVEQVAKVLCDTEGGLTNGQIDRAFSALGLREVNKATGRYQKTKWRRVHETLLGHQQASKSNEVVVRFIEFCLHPGQFVDSPATFSRIQGELNERLSFEGIHLNDQGKVVPGKRANTLSEAAQIADSLVAELRHRNVHPKVLAFSDRELLQKDLFHGVHEATKSIFERLRQATTETTDGAELIDALFGLGNGFPVIAINNCDTDSEKSEHKGFANLIRGAAGIWRNTTAHDPRAVSDVTRLEILDALATLSYIHRRLDTAVNVHTGETVK
jgi:uncharacterized protein (TIGR02391 family)